MKEVWLFIAFVLPAYIVVFPQLQPGLNSSDLAETYHGFMNHLQKLASISEPDMRNSQLNALWDTLERQHRTPFIAGDTVVFLFKGDASSVSWAGDFNGWEPKAKGYEGTKLGLSNIWYSVHQFPHDARLDYKIIADGNWILDPANTYIQMSGMGPNSELRMPGYIFPEITLADPNAPHGKLSGNIILHSNAQNLNYDIQYRVYTPPGYERLSKLPVVYVTDGHEYADDAKGAMINVLDNLLHRHIIQPVIAVFIDPRDPNNPGNNRRMEEYSGNIKFVNFVADELVPAIDSVYKTNPGADARAIMGASLGGWNAAYIGITRNDRFHLLIIHSPAFNGDILKSYQKAPLLPLKIFMSSGVINDTEKKVRKMKQILEKKGYSLIYEEVNEGHSWGNWKGLIDDPLISFFPMQKVIREKKSH